MKDDLPDRAFLLQSDEEYDIRGESRAFPVLSAEQQRKQLRTGDGATVVLKGAKTLVVSADGSRIYENQTGNPFMALGGMGDLLAGVIGARWAYVKGDPFFAAASGVWLHGAASDAVVKAATDPSIVNTAASIGSLRVRLDG